MVFSFLHRVVDIFAEYFGSVSQKTLTINLVTAYQVLEEMLDGGFPLVRPLL